MIQFDRTQVNLDGTVNEESPSHLIYTTVKMQRINVYISIALNTAY